MNKTGKIKKLRVKFITMFRDKMSDEQFKNFVYAFIGSEVLADYVEREVDGRSVNELKDYIKQAKIYLK